MSEEKKVQEVKFINESDLEIKIKQWQDVKYDWKDSYKYQVLHYKKIREYFDKVILFYNENKEKLDELKDTKPVRKEAWLLYDKAQIQFDRFEEINQYLDENNVSIDIRDENNDSIDILDENEKSRLTEALKKNGKVDINWFIDANIKYYGAKCGTDVSGVISDIVTLFKNTNSANSSQGAPKKLINKSNNILDVFYMVLSFKESLYEFEAKLKKIKYLNTVGKEAYSIYNLSKEDGFLYNGRLENVFPEIFESFPSNESLSVKQKYYDKLREKYIGTIDSKIDIQLKEILQSNNIETVTEALNINIQLDQFIYWYDAAILSSKKNLNALSLLDILKEGTNPNIILYGAPGTGKTFNAKKIIDVYDQCYMSENKIQDKDSLQNRTQIVQFHPSFSYEDFIDGIKPIGIDNSGNVKFNLQPGIFRKFCKKAKSNPEQFFYFIIDEINRAELSRVFGELLYCLEYRDEEIETQYSALRKSLGKDEKFSIPGNVIVIGTMNTTDKSIDSFDLALRRRFVWLEFIFNPNVLYEEYSEHVNIKELKCYIDYATEINNLIVNDLKLPKDYQIGHSYFLKIADIEQAVNMKINSRTVKPLENNYLKPLLKEYCRSFISEDELESKVNAVFDEARKAFSKVKNNGNN